MRGSTFIAREKYRLDALKEEYRATESAGRFLLGLRYAVFAGVMAILGSLFAAYNGAFGLSTAHHHLFAQFGPATIGVLALILILAGVRLEQRLRQMYEECLKRAAEIERSLGVADGIFTRLEHMPRERFISSTGAVRMFAGAIALAWLALIIFALIAWRS